MKYKYESPARLGGASDGEREDKVKFGHGGGYGD